jgi:hypothetical protein
VITPILHTSDSGPDFLFNTSGATYALPTTSWNLLLASKTKWISSID